MQEEMLLQIIKKQQEMIDLMLQSGIKISDTNSPNAQTFSYSATTKKQSKDNNGIKTFDEEGFKQYLTSKGRSENSIDTYVRGVKSFFKIHKTLSIQHLEEYETELKNKWKPKTVNLRIAGMNAYFKYIKFTGFEFHRSKEQKKTYCNEAINEAQYAKLITWAKDNAPKVWLIAKVIAGTGVRVSELINLKTETLNQGYADIIGKGNKLRRIYYPEKLVNEIRNYCGKIFILENKYGRQMTTRGVYSLINKASEKAGIPKEVMHPHSFRHFFAKEFLKNNNDITLLGDLLGHSDVSTTAIYTRMTSAEQAKQINEIVRW